LIPWYAGLSWAISGNFSGLAPREGAAVDQDPADGGAVAGEPLGRRLPDEVGAVVERAAEVRGRERVVDEQRDAVVVGDVGDPLDVGRDQGRVPDGFEVDVGGVFVDRLRVPLVVERVDEPRRDPAPLDGVGEIRVGAAVQRRRRDDVVARGREHERRQIERRHPGRRGDRADAVLEGGDPLFESGVRRVHNPRVDVSGLLQCEQPGGVLGVLELVGSRLVDRRGARAGRGVRLGAGVDASGAEFAIGVVSVGWHTISCRAVRLKPTDAGGTDISEETAEFVRTVNSVEAYV